MIGKVRLANIGDDDRYKSELGIGSREGGESQKEVGIIDKRSSGVTAELMVGIDI